MFKKLKVWMLFINLFNDAVSTAYHLECNGLRRTWMTAVANKFKAPVPRLGAADTFVGVQWPNTNTYTLLQEGHIELQT